MKEKFSLEALSERHESIYKIAMQNDKLPWLI